MPMMPPKAAATAGGHRRVGAPRVQVWAPLVDGFSMQSGESFELVLAAAQRGDDRAVARLYRDLHPRLVRYLNARAPRAAEDLEGDIWLAVAEGIARFSGGEKAFRTWVFLLARRALADLRRTAA